jgi:hypothetical protein
MSIDGSYHEPAESTNQLLLWAFVISVAGHLFLWGTYETLSHFHLLDRSFLPSWLASSKQIKALELKTKPPQQPKHVVEQETQLVFVEVDPETITAEAPKNAKYYSSKNSQAANAEAVKDDLNNPNIAGKEAKVPRIKDSERSKSVPLQPSAPKQPTPKEQDQAESKPKPKGGKAVGDLAMAKPSEKKGDGKEENVKDPGEALTPTHKRPNTLVEAKMREALSGHKMKEDGGVKRHLRLDSLDTRATAFGEYDRQLIEAIQKRWFNILESKEFTRDRAGRVVVEFNLNSDGRITDMRVVENTVDDLLAYVCERAVLEPAPYAVWPMDMRKVLDTDKRDVRFTFYYE